MPPIKVCITGGAGQIAYSLIFRIASGAVFGQNVPIELSLLEVEPALEALKGVAMEVEDCAFPLIQKLETTSDPNQAFQGTDYNLLVGAAPRKLGMERQDLIHINAPIFVEQGKAIGQNSKANSTTLVIGNPCNTNCYIALNSARAVGATEQSFCAMTFLDQNRAVAQIASKLACPVNEVSNVLIWGNHSPTMYPDFENCTRNSTPIQNLLTEEWLKTEFIKGVQQRGTAIIKARKSSSAASAAQAVIDSIQSILGIKKDVFSLAIESDGSYNIDKGIIFSFPIIRHEEGLKIKQNYQLSAFAKEKINLSLEELLLEKKLVDKYLN